MSGMYPTYLLIRSHSGPILSSSLASDFKFVRHSSTQYLNFHISQLMLTSCKMLISTNNTDSKKINSAGTSCEDLFLPFLLMSSFVVSFCLLPHPVHPIYLVSDIPTLYNEVNRHIWLSEVYLHSSTPLFPKSQKWRAISNSVRKTEENREDFLRSEIQCFRNPGTVCIFKSWKQRWSASSIFSNNTHCASDSAKSTFLISSKTSS